jgi:hypothetical protein
MGHLGFIATMIPVCVAARNGVPGLDLPGGLTIAKGCRITRTASVVKRFTPGRCYLLA